MRRAKIVCTLGPASSSPEVIDRMIVNGANVFRLNFSHGTHEDHAAAMVAIREAAERRNVPVAILQDLCGPKIRVGQLPKEGVVAPENGRVALCAEDAANAACERLATLAPDAPLVPVAMPDFASRLEADHRVYINDGVIRLRVEAVEGDLALCRVVAGGKIESRKGVNLPGAAGRVDPITDKDLADLRMGLEHDVDFVALSFVRSAEDIRRLRGHMREAGRVKPIIAKIEKAEAVLDMEAILAEADGIMVARGDLGVEVDLAETPLIQKRLIRACNAAAKPVITATQMLESMIERPIPTRAEVSDVANAIFDGTDAVMLSGETAVGRRPAETVAMMAEIVERADDVPTEVERYDERPRHEDGCGPAATADAIGHAAYLIAEDLGATGLIACTMSGSTARLIARSRPRQRLFAVTPSRETWRRLALTWGVEPLLADIQSEGDSLVGACLKAIRNNTDVQGPACFVLTAGLPLQTAGITNLLRVVSAAE